MKYLLKKLIRQEWGIGFIINPLDDVINNRPLTYKWVKNPFRNRWFADPFILDVTDDFIYILAEDFEDKKGYACISKLVIDRKTFSIIDVRKILDDGSHMSFPVIVRKEDGIYVHPENGVSGNLKLYKYDIDRDILLFHSVLSDLPLADAVSIHKDGASTMFATQGNSNPNGNILDILELRNDKYEVVNNITFNSNIARMAGDIFMHDGKYYRPAQDNNQRYGGALVIQEMKRCEGKFLFSDVRRIESTHPKLKTGLHTFNVYKNIIVIDVHGFSGNIYVSSFFNKLRYLLFPR